MTVLAQIVDESYPLYISYFIGKEQFVKYNVEKFSNII